MTPTTNEDGSTLIGEKGKIYLIPNEGTENQNVYDEYVWTNNTWEKIGTTKVDLSEYAKTTDLAGYAKSVKINTNTSIAADSTTGVIDLSSYKLIKEFYNEIAEGSDYDVPNVSSVKLVDGGESRWGIGVINATSTDKGLVTLSSTVDASNTGAVTGAGVASAISGLASDAEVVKTIKVNSDIFSPTDGQIDIGNVVTGVASRSAETSDGVLGVVNGQIVDNELELYVHVASETQQGVTYVYDKTATGLGSDSTATVSENTVKSVYNTLNGKIPTIYVSTVNGNFGPITIKAGGNFDNVTAFATGTSASNLWGLNVDARGTEQRIIDGFIGDKITYGNIGTDYAKTASLPAGATKVIGNFVYGSDGKVIDTIRAERMVSGFYGYTATGLTEWVADMPNLKDGWDVFYDGGGHITPIKTFIGDLSSLENGENMFYFCTALETFIGDLSSLINGNLMFGGTSSSSSCKLNAESVERILETIPTYTDGSHYLGLGIHVDAVETFNEITGAQLPATKQSYLYDVPYKGWTIEVRVSNED